MKPGEAIIACHKAANQLGWAKPLFMPLHSGVRSKYKETNAIQTMDIDTAGNIRVNPTFVETIEHVQIGPKRVSTLQGVIAHELMHKVLGHGFRRGAREPKRWNAACDMLINSALKSEQVPLPQNGLYLPIAYNGPKDAESLYAWLEAEEKGGAYFNYGNGAACCGCGVILAPGSKDDSAQQSAECRAVLALSGGSAAGKGHSALLDLLTPAVSRLDWRKVLGRGFQLANAPRKDYQTYMRRGRRSPTEGPQIPGWAGNTPSVALVIDVSGSMDRDWVAEIVGHASKLVSTYSGTRCFTVTHTDEVAWSGWITDNTQKKLIEATAFTGGTDAVPAYDLVRKTGKFDVCVHFTDCELYAGWPAPPARRMVIGAYGSGAHGGGTKPPHGAEVIPCDRLA